ncbi:Sugar fermentation stimulation protein A [Pontiella desulfatans]|uniref:Sugar fermentation stimulation protein homolog n=1 Tax=Pontiella desulfatans TaxID=2750659 RepID=A0A6C2UEH8_PONDE|nr:DNA/RNA nuclease SfsA [Pontiella desulfatans]VGO17831.1 Sugar fermentation stimulation protein A [Pontiella desulfatans]
MELPPVIFGTLIKRYKRFLADVELDDGSIITAHCPNTGRMTTCAEPGWRVALSDSQNPKRKYRYTWELVHNGDCWICVNTGRANEMAFEAVSNKVIPELAGYDEVLREQTFGNSRFDLLLKRGDDLCYVEVKNVTLLADDGCYAFPDAVTERGRKHLNELVDVVKAGHRAAMLFVIPRSDGTTFRAAHEIDPQYADALEHAASNGVEVHAWGGEVSPGGLKLVKPAEIIF